MYNNNLLRKVIETNQVTADFNKAHPDQTLLDTSTSVEGGVRNSVDHPILPGPTHPILPGYKSSMAPLLAETGKTTNPNRVYNVQRLH